MRDDEMYATGTNKEQAVIMPSTCGVTWLWAILSATNRSPEASVELAVGCSIAHPVVDPLNYAVMSVLLAHGVRGPRLHTN